MGVWPAASTSVGRLCNRLLACPLMRYAAADGRELGTQVMAVQYTRQ